MNSPPESSPIVAVYDRLRALNPSWDVTIGEPEGDQWIRGVDLATPDRGRLSALLEQIGARLQTPNRKVIAAAFALRFGWSSAAALGPYLVARCVPEFRLENVSLRFSAGTLFERVALHRARSTMLRREGDRPHPDVTFVEDPPALLARLRDTLLENAEPVVGGLYAWSRFPRRAIWGQLLSSWGAPLTQILAYTGAAEAKDAVAIATDFFDDPRPAFKMRPRFYTVARTSGDGSDACHRRASCCLYYKLPTGSYCASCPLLPFEESVRRQADTMARMARRA